MKGSAASSAPLKRRWKGFALAVVVLVFLSLLVPLVFLLGLHNRFPYGHLTEDSWSLSSAFGRIEKAAQKTDIHPGEDDPSGDLEDLARRFGPFFPKDDQNVSKKGVGDLQTESSTLPSPPTDFHSEDSPASQTGKHEPPLTSENVGEPVQKGKQGKPKNKTEKSCQLEFGSYCLWSVENKEKMQDSLVKKMKDQLFVARSLFPSVAKIRSAEKLSLRMKQSIQDHERMLSDALVDADLPLSAPNLVHGMEEIISKAKSFHFGCFNVNKKLEQILELTEDEAHFHRRQSAFLYRLGVQTMPKSLHCLPLRLTVEYFNSPPSDLNQEHPERLADPSLRHYVLFSTNVLASSVAVNSTVMNAEESKGLVFHVLTDSQNFFSMKLWFLRNRYEKAVVHVTDTEEYLLSDSRWVPQLPLSLSEEFRISIPTVDPASSDVDMRTEYVSAPSRLFFLLPEIFKSLNKIVVLDDDVVVQRDLSPLWSVDLQGKVNAAVESCAVRLGDLESLLGQRSYNRDTCLFLSGLNVVDLDRWRQLNVSGTYEELLSEHAKSKSSASRRTATLPSSLLALQGRVRVLDDEWVLSGLGVDFSVNADAMERAAVLHYNGNMKPWLELGIPTYKSYWKSYLPRRNRFMDECNVS